MTKELIEQSNTVSSFAWALIMETAASFEVASYSISDEDAKKSAEGAIKYARYMANKYYTSPPKQAIPDVVIKAMTDEIQTLRTKVASADVLVEDLRKTLIDLTEKEKTFCGNWSRQMYGRDTCCDKFDGQCDSCEGEDCQKKLTTVVESITEALATYDKLSEVNHD